jgi:predicted secreted acid phosphatase
MKALEIGKQEKDKTLILDMDETMIATSFEGKSVPNFNKDFDIDFQGKMISVSFRPYLA